MKKKQMYYPKLWDRSMPSNWEKFYKLQQFTGLHDTYGLEIYEGDIVRINQVERNYVVKFHNGCFKLFNNDPKSNDIICVTIERVSELLWSLEIFANIYEDPEFLQS